MSSVQGNPRWHRLLQQRTDRNVMLNTYAISTDRKYWAGQKMQRTYQEWAPRNILNLKKVTGEGVPPGGRGKRSHGSAYIGTHFEGYLINWDFIFGFCFLKLYTPRAGKEEREGTEGRREEEGREGTEGREGRTGERQEKDRMIAEEEKYLDEYTLDRDYHRGWNCRDFHIPGCKFLPQMQIL